ncbi:hypothetical protein MRB53_039336 [Persea americana]|nr:hypothetical protein MRB53_039336 [Persea americana]
MIVEHEPHGVRPADKAERKVVGALMCQSDTYLTHLQTTVCNCDKNKTGKGDEAYELQFQDTILFPEGGGQPWDYGVVKTASDEVPIKKIVRRKLEAIHYAPRPLEIGTPVDMTLDFGRRFDHAQQHSGQHLLSAVLDQLDIPTLAWTMGPEIVYVEIGRLPDDLKAVEDRCNEYIRQNLPITVTETREVPKNLPQDYDASAGVIRVVSIGGIDANPCCGTHVRSTAELNSLTILFTSTVRANNHRIHFVVGGRCQKQLSTVYRDGRSMGANLSCPINDVPAKVSALQTQLKDLNKQVKLLKAEVVASEAQKLESQLQTGKAFLHRPSGDVEFLNSVLSSLPNPLPNLCIVVGGEKSGGPIMISGPDADVKEASAKIKEALPHVKGGGRPGRYQGKSPSFSAADLACLKSLAD